MPRLATGEPLAQDRRRLILVAAAGAALLVALLTWFLVLSGRSGGSGTSASVPPAHLRVAPNVSASPTSTPSSASSFSSALSAADAGTHDPFAPLPEEAVASATAQPSAPAGAGAPSDSGAGTASGTSASGTSASGTTSSDTASKTPKAGIMLVSVSGDKATIEVDGQRSQVNKGASFGTGNAYTLTAVTAKGATVSHGSTTKTLAVGESQTF